MLRDFAWYGLARGAGAAFNLALVVVYTHFLAPHQYGLVGLILATMAVLDVALVSWSRGPFFRFWHAASDDRNALASTTLTIFAGYAVGVAGLGLVLAVFLPAHALLWAVGCATVILTSWFEHAQMVQRLEFRLRGYVLLTVVRGLVALAAGSCAIVLGAGVYSPFIGLMAGAMCALTPVTWRAWRAKATLRPRAALAVRMFRFGMPFQVAALAGVAGIAFVRWMVTSVTGVAAAGYLSAAQDLSDPSLAFALGVVNLAAIPRLAAASCDAAETRRSLERNLALLLLLGLPAALTLTFEARWLGPLVLGSRLGQDGGTLLPLLAIGGLATGIRAYHFDLAFYVAEQTNRLWGVALCILSGSVALALVLVPRFGPAGAAMALAGGALVGAAASLALGRLVYRVPLLGLDAQRVALAVAAAAISWLVLRQVHTPPIWRLTGAAATYGAALLWNNALGMRKGLAARFWLQPGKLVADIVLVIPTLNRGGAETAAVRLANEWNALGLRVILAVAVRDTMAMGGLDEGVRFVSLEAHSTIRATLRIARLLRSARPSAVVSGLDHANLPTWAAWWLAGQPGKIVFTAHNTFSVNFQSRNARPKERIMGFMAAPFYRRAARIIAVSHQVAADLQKSLRLPPAHVRVIYNPVPLLVPTPPPRAPHAWLRGPPPTVLAVGRLVRAKGFDILIEAIACAQASSPLRALIVGDGPERPTLQGLIDRRGLEKSVELIGFQPNLTDFLFAASAFALPSRWEGLPTTLVEALGSGIPIVATDVSGVREILEGGRWGLIVRPEAAEELAAALLVAVRQDRQDRNAAMARFSPRRAALEYLTAMGMEKSA